MKAIQWTHPGIELRVGSGPPIARFEVAGARSTSGPALRVGPAAHPDLALPCLILPLMNSDGDAVDQSPLADLPYLRGTLVLPSSHARIGSAAGIEAEVIPLAWLPGIDEAAARALQEALGSMPGVLVDGDEHVISLGASLSGGAFLRRLPRVLLKEFDRVADNTDATVSMGYLLDQFVKRFGKDDDAFPNVWIATGYLYAQGLVRVLGLLRNPKVECLKILFSGRTDRATAALLTRGLEERLEESAELLNAEEWKAFRTAAESGRLQIRVYPDAFLHAKLFLGFTKFDNHGRLQASLAVVGSSNVSTAGMAERGNLELNVALHDPVQNTDLHKWLLGRWDEAVDPDPALLEILERKAPPAEPAFTTPGLMQVYEAGRDARLLPPEAHLAYLAAFYRDRLTNPEHIREPAFPDSDLRKIRPSVEQEVGVKALARRLLTARLAFLADGVGIGKTITSIGTAWYLKRTKQVEKIALIAPQKLWAQWAMDAEQIDAPPRLMSRINRHKLERLDDAQAAMQLDGFDLLIVEEAAESLRSRSNLLWVHLRNHLRRHLDCRILLISATPWNNRREDILNYLLLAWNDGRLLQDRYRDLDTAPLQNHIGQFMIQPVGQLPATASVRWFQELPLDRYRQIFDFVFVQRTRSSLAARYDQLLDFPKRNVHAWSTDVYEPYDSLFVELRKGLDRLTIPYREPFDALLRAAAVGEEPQASNLHNSFILHLYKRAESSTFALAISLATVERRLLEFRTKLNELATSTAPRAALEAWLREVYVKLDPEEGIDDGEGGGATDASTKGKLTRLAALIGSLDDTGAKMLILRVVVEQVEPDLAIIKPLRARISSSIEDKSPKDVSLCNLARRAFDAHHKPILIAGFADTATRFFIRLLATLPDATIGLALGGDEAWVSRPGDHDRTGLTEAEWNSVLDLEPGARRDSLLRLTRRAERRVRADVIAAFAPVAQKTSEVRLTLLKGEIEILVGSEAIAIGQNLQDSTCLLHLDMPWNPMVLEQRIGRIDRRGGGRVNPDAPTGQRLVDIHYCWSSAAIEEEVHLRDLLKKKASQAIDDTNFDEMLLYELKEKLQGVRTERKGKAGFTGEDKHLADVLGARQQSAVEGQNQVGGIPVGAGSDLDALDALAVWRAENPSVATPDPVVAAGMEPPSTAAEGLHWLVSVEAIPMLLNRNPAGPARLHHFAIRDGENGLHPDMEAVVRRLVNGGEPVTRPGTGRGAWMRALGSIDGELQSWRKRYVEEHNREVAERSAAQTAPAAKRHPSNELRLLATEARDNMVAAMKQVPKEALMPLVERLTYLLKSVLDPGAALDLLVDQDEAVVKSALRFIVSQPKAFLTGDFDNTFDQLCGARFAARNAQPSVVPQQQSLLDNLWHDVEIRVVAATWCNI